MLGVDKANLLQLCLDHSAKFINDSKWTINCCFKSILKHNSQGKLTKVIEGEFCPYTGKCIGKAVIITGSSYRLVIMDKQACYSSCIDPLVVLAYHALHKLEKGDEDSKLIDKEDFKVVYDRCVAAGKFKWYAQDSKQARPTGVSTQLTQTTWHSDLFWCGEEDSQHRPHGKVVIVRPGWFIRLALCKDGKMHGKEFTIFYSGDCFEVIYEEG
jgi:hypothetical protein